MTTEWIQIPEISPEERSAKFREVITANAEKVGGENGKDLIRLGELILEYQTLGTEDRKKLDEEKLLPLYGKLAQSAEKDILLTEVLGVVNWWYDSLF